MTNLIFENIRTNLIEENVFNNNVIAGFGNPLIDISTTITDDALLKQYNLQPNGQKEVSLEEINTILLSLARDDHQMIYSPGGCTQNTLRIIQKLVKHSNFCVMFGGLGNDKRGRIMESHLKCYGVHTRYAKQSTHITGMACALIYGDSRSLVAHLGAAEVYGIQDFKTPENLKIFEQVYVVYIEGFFITHSNDVAVEAITCCHNSGITVVFNICGTYVADVCPDALVTAACAADIVVGNQSEVKSLAKLLGLEREYCEDTVIELYSTLWTNSHTRNVKLKPMNSYGKMLIITDGKEPVVCVSKDKKVIHYKVPQMKPEDVKDTTGAGDAFVAGFLLGLLQNISLSECLSAGCRVAQEVIKHIGVNIEEVPTCSDEIL